MCVYSNPIQFYLKIILTKYVKMLVVLGDQMTMLYNSP